MINFDIKAEKLTLKTSYLSADRVTSSVAPLPSDAQIKVITENKIDNYFYYYNLIGLPFLWWEKRLLDMPAKKALVAEMEMYKLEISGKVAGIAFLNFGAKGFKDKDKDKDNNELYCDLDLFAITEDFRGKKLGSSWLVFAMMRGLYGKGKRTLTINTCNFDHPIAFEFYKRYGFKLIKTIECEIKNPITQDNLLNNFWSNKNVEK